MNEKSTPKRAGFVLILWLLLSTIIFFILNFLLNFILEIVQKTFGTDSILKPEDINFIETVTKSLTIKNQSLITLSVLLFITIVTSSIMVYKIISNFGNLEKNQKGSSRFTTFKEIKKQYRNVPDKKERFEGGGGVPIARYKNRLFIDDSPVNNLIIGTTRSGKGETFVFSAIDIYSRAKNQASMILNDPKGELYAASKETLEGLGYHVEVLNLMNPLQSMSYNLLELTIEAFLDGNYSLAQQYARSVSFMLYYDPKAKDPFWSNASTDLCTALILALCEQCKNEPEKITMYNVAIMLSELGTKQTKDENGNDIYALDAFFEGFPENHPARMQYATVRFAAGVTRASILANTNAKLGVFTLDGTAKLTSKNTFNMSKIGFNRWIKGRTEPNTRIKVTFPNAKTETIRTDAEGIFTIYHKHELKENDEVVVKQKNIETIIKVKGKFYRETEDGRKVFEGRLQTETNNDKVEVLEMVEFNKPTAIFMIVPDYDATFNVIASLYVKQVYTSLARIASNTEGGKCHREVIFLLDEFGNMPCIEGMANIITVCLGRNIRFNLVIQAYSQLENLYGDDWKTIDGNCGNTLYLLTNDESTAELISKKLGEKTIVTKSRSGETISLSKSKTESVDSRRLLTATEVMGLKEGEMIVIRVIKRQDKKRNRIKSYPIFLTGKTALKYRWEYLADYYNTDKSIHDIDIPCEHTMLDLNKYKANFENNTYHIEKESIIENEIEETNDELMETSDNSEHLLEKNKADNHIEDNPVQSFYDIINEKYRTQQVIPKGLIVQTFGDKAQEYLEMGIVEFRDFILSNNEDIEDKICSVMLSKIDNAIKKVEEDLQKGVESNVS